MFDHIGFVTDEEQSKLEVCLAEIKASKPWYSHSERITLRGCWRFKDERNMTEAEAKEIYGINSRIGVKKNAHNNT